jgi:hypothetical protein
MNKFLYLAAPLALAAALVPMTAAAAARPAAEVVFRGAAPEAVAPLLATECTRRRMALIRNTPEEVVCRRAAPAKAARGSGEGVNELWSFVLDRMSRGRTKVRARASLEAAAQHGYALLSLREVAPESRTAMRGFMETVRDGALLNR